MRVNSRVFTVIHRVCYLHHACSLIVLLTSFFFVQSSWSCTCQVCSTSGFLPPLLPFLDCSSPVHICMICTLNLYSGRIKWLSMEGIWISTASPPPLLSLLFFFPFFFPHQVILIYGLPFPTLGEHQVRLWWQWNGDPKADPAIAICRDRE